MPRLQTGGRASSRQQEEQGEEEEESFLETNYSSRVMTTYSYIQLKQAQLPEKAKSPRHAGLKKGPSPLGFANETRPDYVVDQSCLGTDTRAAQHVPEWVEREKILEPIVGRKPCLH